ncbi:MAG: hypothetical protein Q4D02_06030 [Clostridia bacterium]|nr:hypothetical protein [Clostridia bacterium]
MSGTRTIHCVNCNAPITVEINRSRVFCNFCGAQNIIDNEEMKVNINVNSNMNIKAKTDDESLKRAVEFAISSKNFDRANELIMTSIITGTSDYYIYILKAMIDLQLDNNAALFESLDTIIEMEKVNSSPKMQADIKKLMNYRGKNGVQVLHNATFHEKLDIVKYCVEHGADVNSVAGMNQVTPISIMFVPISSNLSKLDGTPFIRDKQKVKAIRDYLLQHGARDKSRFGY